MSAKADAEAAAALRELGATLKASTNAPKLHTWKVLHELGLDEEEDELGGAEHDGGARHLGEECQCGWSGGR